MRATVLSISRALLPLIVLTLSLTLLAAPSSAVAAPPAEQPARTPVVNQVPTEDDESGEDLSVTGGDLQQDFASLIRVQTSAQSRVDVARKEAGKLRAKLQRNQKAVTAARKLVGAHMRSIYINGSTDLKMMASIIDAHNLGDLIKKADVALRVGEHKDARFDRAVALLRRTEAAKAASDASLDAAKTSLAAVEDRVNGLRERRADIAGELAGRIQSSGANLDAEQAKYNGGAAINWAEYLGQLAEWRVPPFTAHQLSKGPLPKGLTKSKRQPGVAMFRKGQQRLVVLPERTIAAVTYSVSLLGSDYRWKANTATELDCSALMDRSWNVPALPADERAKDRALVAGGVRGLAQETRLLSARDRRVGDLLFLSDPGAGVNHVGIAVTKGVMIASDSTTGAVNALPINNNRVWKAGRAILPAPKRANPVPKATKKPFQCGADPATLISFPDGKTLGNVKLCPPAPGVFSEANMQPSAILAARCAARSWPQIQSIGGFRPADAHPDHPSGRAIDLMIPGGCSMGETSVRLGNVIAEFFMENSEKFNVEYIIWNQRMWNGVRDPKTAPPDWRQMGDRGGCTANHIDHVHLTVKGPNVNPGRSVGNETEYESGDVGTAGSSD